MLVEQSESPNNESFLNILNLRAEKINRDVNYESVCLSSSQRAQTLKKSEFKACRRAYENR